MGSPSLWLPLVATQLQGHGEDTGPARWSQELSQCVGVRTSPYTGSSVIHCRGVSGEAAVLLEAVLAHGAGPFLCSFLCWDIRCFRVLSPFSCSSPRLLFSTRARDAQPGGWAPAHARGLLPAPVGAAARPLRAPASAPAPPTRSGAWAAEGAADRPLRLSRPRGASAPAPGCEGRVN